MTIIRKGSMFSMRRFKKKRKKKIRDMLRRSSVRAPRSAGKAAAFKAIYEQLAIRHPPAAQISIQEHQLCNFSGK